MLLTVMRALGIKYHMFALEPFKGAAILKVRIQAGFPVEMSFKLRLESEARNWKVRKDGEGR